MKNKHTKNTVPSEIEASVEVITPVIAKKMLEGNTDNRKLRKTRVSQYADAMKRGLWDIQNDAITISKSGRLINGQHRLNAIIEADTSCQCLVLRGVDESTYTVIDAGLSRTVNDALGAAGLGLNATHLSPIVKTLVAMDAGLNIYDTNAMALVQRQDILDYCGDHTEILEWALCVARKADKAVGGIRHAWGVFAILAASKHGREKAEEFVNLVIDGVGLKTGDSPLALRNWLGRQRGSWGRNASKGNIAIFIHIFNKWVANETVAVVKPLGQSWDTFPEVVRA